MTWILKAHSITVPPPTTPGVDTTGANVIQLCMCAFGTVSAPIDNYSNTWRLVTSKFSGNCTLYFYDCIGPTVGTGHTFTTPNSTTSLTMEAWGMLSPSVDVSNGSATFFSGRTSTYQDGGVTPTNAGSLIISAFLGGTFDPTGMSIDSGFTITDVISSGGYFGSGLAYLIQTTAISENPTWTIPNTTNDVGIINVVYTAPIPPSGLLMQSSGQLYPMQYELAQQFAALTRNNGQLFPL